MKGIFLIGLLARLLQDSCIKQCEDLIEYLRQNMTITTQDYLFFSF